MPSDRRRPSVWQNLFLVRHGESTANEINRFAGAIDAPLTPLGRAQAKRAGGNWRQGDVDRVYVSPLLRAQQTADILLDCLWQTGAPDRVLQDGRLSERDFGNFTLKNKTSLQRRFGLRDYEAALYHSNHELHGGESFAAFHDRVLDFIKHELYPLLCHGQRVLVVAHKYVIELLSRLILRLPESEGYDLRLPNARVIAGTEIERYVKRESPVRNWLNDFVVVHHAPILSLAAAIGLLTNATGILASPPQWLLLLLLVAATAISLARVSLANPSGGGHEPALSPPLSLVFRFVALPWIVTILIATSWPGAGVAGADLLMGVALLLAAPSAVTAVVLSRASGGMIVPSALIVLVSTAMSLANTIALLAYFGQSDLTLQAFLLVAVSSGSLLLPVLAVHVARQRCPIVVAKAAEDHAAIAVGALAVFAVLSFQQITLDSFYPAGLIALAVGISLRLLSLRMARHASLYGIDDYFSMSYPNIFLVIILAGLLGNETVLNVATWFLLPMFALSPLDDRLIRRLQKAQPHFGLLAYLRINHRHARAAETGANPSTHDADEFPSTLMLKQQRSEANTSAH